MCGMPTVVNMDGALVSPERATVSVFDRGFLYGDSVYEVVRTYAGAPFELGLHLARLARSAARLGLPLPWDAARTRAEVARALDASRGGDEPDPGAAPWNVGERSLRIIMTRGAGELGLDPALAVDPRAIVIAGPLRAPPLAAYRDGVACRIVGVRHDAPDAPDTTAKTGAHLANVLAVAEARAGGAHEALLLDRDGLVTEGASSNVFAVREGRLETPPLAAGILEGVTRGRVLALARGARIEVREVALRPADLARADELFLTSTAREILPVTRLDGAAVGSGRVGELTTRVHALFRAAASGSVPAR
jgi:branched-chain amino acid aminotransferase